MALVGSQFSLSILGLTELPETRLPDSNYAISLLDPGAVFPKLFGDSLHRNHLRLPMHDAWDDDIGKQAPSFRQVERLCSFADAIDRDKMDRLLIHCQMGRSRSAAAAAVVLIRLGVETPSSVFDAITQVRDPVWPNWTLLEHGDAILGCKGELLSACKTLQLGIRARFPAWVEDPHPENLPNPC